MAEVEKVLRLYRESYFDLNVKHFVEKLQRPSDPAQLYLGENRAANAGLVKRTRNEEPITRSATETYRE